MWDNEEEWDECSDEDDGDRVAGLSDDEDGYQSGDSVLSDTGKTSVAASDWHDEQDPLSTGPQPENAIEEQAPQVNESDSTYATLVRLFDKPVDEEKIQYVASKTDTTISLKLLFVRRFEMDVEFYSDKECTDSIGDREFVYGMKDIFFELRAFYAYEGVLTIERVKGCSHHAMAVRTHILRLRDMLQAMEYEQKHANKFVKLPDKKKDRRKMFLKPAPYGMLKRFRSRCTSGEKSSMPSLQAELVQHLEFLLPKNIIRRFFDPEDKYGRLIDGTVARSRWEDDERDESLKGPIPHAGLMWKKNIQDEDMTLFDPVRTFVGHK